MYKPNNDRLKDYFDKTVIPSLKEVDIDYYKLIDVISLDLGISETKVNDMLERYKKAKKIKEIRILTIPDELLNDSLDFIARKKQVKKEAIEELDKTMSSIEQELNIRGVKKK